METIKLKDLENHIQTQIQNFPPLFDDLNDEQFPPLLPTKQVAQESYQLVEMERVSLFLVDEKAILSGVILCPDTQEEFHCSLQLTQNQGFYPVERNLPASFHLALLLKFVQFKSCNKQKRIFNKIIAAAPEWIKRQHPFVLDFSAMGKSKASTGKTEKPENCFFTHFENLTSYHSFLILQEMAFNLEHKGKLTNGGMVLALHILKIYGGTPWPVVRSAMEALINRFQRVKEEELVVFKGPKRDIFGFYKVKNKTNRFAKPYQIHLRGNQGIEGSCSCKDYQKNTLRCCKHLAAVYFHWNKDLKTSRKFQRKVPLVVPTLLWIPPINLKDSINPMAGINCLNLDLASRGRISSKLLEQLAGYFNSKGLILLHKIGSFTEKSRFLELLNRCHRYFKTKNFLMDPAIIPLVKEELEYLSWPHLFEKKKNEILNQVLSKNLKMELYPFQREGVENALSKGKFLLADEMGLGKTIQGIAFTECLLKGNFAKRALLICPASLKSQWKREWKLVSGRVITIVEGSREERLKIYKEKHSVFAINYELLHRDLVEILTLGADLIILDEAQRIKNFNTETSKRIKCLQPFFRLVLTGTPMENRIEELASLMDWIKPASLGPYWRLNSELSFHNPNNPEERGIQNLSAIRERFANYFLRRTRKQVLSQLPSRSDCPIYLPITEKQMEIHQDLSVKVRRLMAISETRPLRPEEHIRLMAYLAKMRIVSNGLAQYNFSELWPKLKNEKTPLKHFEKLYSPKLAEFRNLIQGLMTQDGIKITIFSQWQGMLRLCHWAIHDLLNFHNVEAVFFTGKESAKRRTENIVRFHDDPKVRLFFATDAGGVGLNLQRAANICINLELPWNPAVLEQRIGRIFRIGQELPIQIFNLITKDSIEERISILVEQKRDVFLTLFEKDSDQFIFNKDSSFYQQVRNVIGEDVGEVIEGEKWNEPPGNFEDSVESRIVGEEVEFNEDLLNTLPEKNITQVPVHNDLPSPSFELLKNIKIEQSEGSLKIEASGESAKLMADMFRTMALIFDQLKK